jgi:C4-dicarboxylate transporter
MSSRILIGVAVIIALVAAYIVIMKKTKESFGSAGGSLIQLTTSQVPGKKVFDPSPRLDQEVVDEIQEMTEPAPKAVHGFSFGLVENAPFA